MCEFFLRWENINNWLTVQMSSFVHSVNIYDLFVTLIGVHLLKFTVVLMLFLTLQNQTKNNKKLGKNNRNTKKKKIICIGHIFS